MSFMFARASAFNQPIGSWNVSNVITMFEMFREAYSFNRNISSWDVSHVIAMQDMFRGAGSFNQNISSWDVSSVLNMSGMFYSAAAFDQNIGSWNVANVTNMSDMFRSVTLSTANYSGILTGWAALPSLQSGVSFHGGYSRYNSSAEPAREMLTDTCGWTIIDGGLQ